MVAFGERLSDGNDRRAANIIRADHASSQTPGLVIYERWKSLQPHEKLENILANMPLGDIPFPREWARWKSNNKKPDDKESAVSCLEFLDKLTDNARDAAAFTAAIILHHHGVMNDLLQKKDFLPDFAIGDRLRSLSLAVLCRNSWAVEAIASHPLTQIDARVLDKETAATIAARIDDRETVNTLLTHYADPFLSHGSGQRLVDLMPDLVSAHPLHRRADKINAPSSRPSAARDFTEAVNAAYNNILTREIEAARALAEDQRQQHDKARREQAIAEANAKTAALTEKRERNRQALENLSELAKRCMEKPEEQRPGFKPSFQDPLAQGILKVAVFALTRFSTTSPAEFLSSITGTGSDKLLIDFVLDRKQDIGAQALIDGAAAAMSANRPHLAAIFYLVCLDSFPAADLPAPSLLASITRALTTPPPAPRARGISPPRP